MTISLGLSMALVTTPIFGLSQQSLSSASAASCAGGWTSVGSACELTVTSSSTISLPAESSSFDILVVGAGGGGGGTGGSPNGGNAGGGGGGEVKLFLNKTLSGSVDITIGEGGSQGPAAVNGTSTPATSGGDGQSSTVVQTSSSTNLVALGGKGGQQGAYLPTGSPTDPNYGKGGASGSGNAGGAAGWDSSFGVGNGVASDAPGGGGGDSAAGTSGISGAPAGGTGGAGTKPTGGLFSSNTTFYGGGGGGTNANGGVGGGGIGGIYNRDATAGTANTGGGGAGAGGGYNTYNLGGLGGSGVVIFRYSTGPTYTFTGPITPVITSGAGGAASSNTCDTITSATSPSGTESVLIGVSANSVSSNTEFSKLTGQCAGLAIDGTSLDSTTGTLNPPADAPSYPISGGLPTWGAISGGTPTSDSCADGKVIVGARVYETTAGGQPQGVKLRCGSLPAGNNVTLNSTAMGPTTSPHYEDINCPTGTVVIGISLRSGYVLDAFGFKCQAIQTESSQVTVYVVPDNKVRTYGESAPTYTYSLHLDSATGATETPDPALTTEPICTSSYTSSTSAGSTPSISCSGAVDSRYLFDYTSTGSVTVNKAMHTFTGSTSASVAFGSNSNSYTVPTAINAGSGDGTLVYSESSSSCSVSSSGIITITGTGECAVTVGTTGSNNYTDTATTTFTLTVDKAGSYSVTYTGTNVVPVGSKINLSSSGVPSYCNPNLFEYQLSTNQIDWIYSSGANQVSTRQVSTSTIGLVADIYYIRVYYAGDSNCNEVYSDGSDQITVYELGSNAFGGGFYTIPGSGKANFGFVVKLVPKTTNTYKGQISWNFKNSWRFKGSLTNFGKSTSSASASGVGTLQYWDPNLYGPALGGWAIAATNVNVITKFTATTASTKKTLGSQGSFVINFGYTAPAGWAFSQLPTVNTLTTLKGGVITFS